MTDEIPPVEEEYLLKIEQFCERNFGTTDLRKCRIALSRAYRRAWEE